mgnify:CR=1 FL=1
MNNRAAKIALLIFLLLLGTVVAVSIISIRQTRMAYEVTQLQPLVVMIADELKAYHRRAGSYPTNLAALELAQNGSFQAMAKENFDESLFLYTSDGRTFRLTTLNIAVPGFKGDENGIAPLGLDQ